MLKIFKIEGTFIIDRVMMMHETTKSPFVKKKSIEILPQMYKYISSYGLFSDNQLSKALSAIFNFLAPPSKKDKEGNKDRGQGFIALGKMSLIVPKHKFMKYVNRIFDSIKNELEAAKPKLSTKEKTPSFNPAIEVLTCVKLMFKNFGDEFRSFFDSLQDYDMVTFTNDLFYFGFNKNLIETLGELSKICKSKYKGITQIKLLNTISIILT